VKLVEDGRMRFLDLGRKYCESPLLAERRDTEPGCKGKAGRKPALPGTPTFLCEKRKEKLVQRLSQKRKNENVTAH